MAWAKARSGTQRRVLPTPGDEKQSNRCLRGSISAAAAGGTGWTLNRSLSKQGAKCQPSNLVEKVHAGFVFCPFFLHDGSNTTERIATLDSVAAFAQKRGCRRGRAAFEGGYETH